MEVMIKDLMDGNPIRGQKGWREGQTGVEENCGFPAVCREVDRCKQTEMEAPFLSKIWSD